MKERVRQERSRQQWHYGWCAVPFQCSANASACGCASRCCGMPCLGHLACPHGHIIAIHAHLCTRFPSFVDRIMHAASPLVRHTMSAPVPSSLPPNCLFCNAPCFYLAGAPAGRNCFTPRFRGVLLARWDVKRRPRHAKKSRAKEQRRKASLQAPMAGRVGAVGVPKEWV